MLSETLDALKLISVTKGVLRIVLTRIDYVTFNLSHLLCRLVARIIQRFAHDFLVSLADAVPRPVQCHSIYA